MPYHLSDPLLRECDEFVAAQCDRAGEVHPHNPLAASDFTTVQSTLHRLQQAIADEAARSDVECFAQGVARFHDLMPVYRLDVLSTDLATDDDMQIDYRAALDKAVRYLDMRQLLVRPDGAAPEVVCFMRAAS